MSDLNLSLYKIESDLAALVSMREEEKERIALIAEEWGENPDIEAQGVLRSAREELEAIEVAIRAYIAAEIRKADSIADLLLMLDRVAGPPKERKDSRIVCELDQEIERLKVRRDNLRERAEHIKGMVAAVMQEMPWRPGKPRKIEGVRHTLSLVGNGGKQPVVVSDEALVPDEFCTVQVTMPVALLKVIEEQAYKHAVNLPALENLRADMRFGQRTPSLSLIAAELERPCEECKGKAVKDLGFDEKPEDGGGSAVISCPACGGSGKRGVPGCSLAERGEHVRVS